MAELMHCHMLRREGNLSWGPTGLVGVSSDSSGGADGLNIVEGSSK